jgi:hypothetical protein
MSRRVPRYVKQLKRLLKAGKFPTVQPGIWCPIGSYPWGHDWQPLTTHTIALYSSPTHRFTNSRP